MKIFFIGKVLSVMFFLSVTLVFGQAEYGFVEGENFRGGVVYKTVNGKNLAMDVFYPDAEKMKSKNPFVVFVHGGGWAGGEKENIYKSAFLGGLQKLVESGVVVATIEYRLAKLSSPDTSYESVTDCKDAARFLIQNAATYQLDETNYALWGGSAGGHLSLVTALVPDDKFPGDAVLSTISPDYKGVVAYYPFTSCLHEPLRPNSIFEDGTLFTRLLGGSVEDNLELATNLSPTEFLDANSLPVLLIHGEQDTTLPVINSTYMKEVGDANSADVELITVTNAEHSFGGNNISPSLEDINISMANFFLEKFGYPTIAVDGEEEESEDAMVGDVFVDENNLKYTVTSLSPNEAEVYGFNDPLTDAVAAVVIPETAKDTRTATTYSITAIGEKAFSGSGNSKRGNAGASGNHVITSIALPSSVKHLRIHAFRDLPNLTIVNLDHVVSTENSILATNPLLIDIGSLGSMETLGNYAIFGCASLKSVTVGASLTTIGSFFIADSGITDIYYNWTAEELANVNMAGGDYLRNSVASDITIHVPTGTTSDYISSPFYLSGMTVLDDVSLSSNVVAKELGFNIYPNPVENILTIENNQLENVEVTVLNMNGSIVLKTRANSLKNYIDLSSFASGIYLLKVSSNSYSFEEKIIKQ